MSGCLTESSQPAPREKDGFISIDGHQRNDIVNERLVVVMMSRCLVMGSKLPGQITVAINEPPDLIQNSGMSYGAFRVAAKGTSFIPPKS